MFAGTAFEPPCQAGRGPDRYHLRCDRCAVGKYAPAGGYCHECPPGAGDEMVDILNMNLFEHTTYHFVMFEEIGERTRPPVHHELDPSF